MASLRMEQSKPALSWTFWFDLTGNSGRFIKECDGFIYNTCNAYEPEAIDATRRWMEESSRKLYTIGPIGILPDTILESSTRSLLAADHEAPGYDAPVLLFMDRILASHGENSLIYVSQFIQTFPHPYRVDTETGQFRCHLEVSGGWRATTSDYTLKSF